MSRQVMGMKVSGETREAPHAVAAIHFSKEWSSEDAPVECSCGHECLVQDWDKHAKRLTVQRPWSDMGPGKKGQWSGPTHTIPDTRVIPA